jgi:hypothetical protein
MTKKHHHNNSLEKNQAFITHREEINFKFANAVINWTFSKNIIDYEHSRKLSVPTHC